MTLRIRKPAGGDYDLDESTDIVESVTVASTVDDTSYIFNFSASFSAGEPLAFTMQAAAANASSYYAGTIAIEHDTST